MTRTPSPIVELAATTKARGALTDAVRRWPRLTEPDQQNRLATHLQRGDTRTMAKKKVISSRVLVLVAILPGCDGLFQSSEEKRIRDLEVKVEGMLHKIATAYIRPVGRYQVVNPNPEYVGKTMLLDTMTGQTWITCTIVGDDSKPIAGTQSNGWCDMSQASGKDD